MKKITTLLAMIAAILLVLGSCEEPSEEHGSAEVPKGSVIAATYSRSDDGTRVVFATDGSVALCDTGDSLVRAAAINDDTVCARGRYTVTADDIARITLTEVLRAWGGIPKDKLPVNTELAVTFSGNDLRITIGETLLSFSTDKKDVSKPSATTQPGDDDWYTSFETLWDSSSPAFSNKNPIDATYLAQQTLTLDDGNFTITTNLPGGTVRGTYKQAGSTITFDDPTLVGGEYTTKASATISGNTLTLKTEEAYQDGDADTEEIIFKRGSSESEWTHSNKVTLSSGGAITYSENDMSCWTGTYAVTSTESATITLNSTFVDGSFGTSPGKLSIQAREHAAMLEWETENGSGGAAYYFAREN